MKNYNSDEPIETPYMKAKQVWDGRMGALANQASMWRIATFSLVAANLLLVAALLFLPSRTQLVPYVVEIDGIGQVKQVGMANKPNYVPQESHIIHSLQSFIYNSRALSTDRKVVRENWRRAYRVLAPKVANQFESYTKENDLDSKIGQLSKTVEVGPVLSLGKGSYQVEWDENTYDKGGNLASKEHFRGTFGISHHQPKSDRELRENPLGVYIQHLDWRRV